MIQTFLALAIVAATAGWMIWRAVRPAFIKGAAAGGCACGSEGGDCKAEGPR